MSNHSNKNKQHDTTITLTLPSTSNGVKRRGTGTLLIQRGELAHLMQFDYTDLADLGGIIQQAEAALVGLEVDPPPDFSTEPEADPPPQKSAKSTKKPKASTPAPDLTNAQQASLF